jgi:redox-regulated HSP33 family molecular chaperone
VVKSHPSWRVPYNGIVELVSSEVAMDVAYYLASSEQRNTAIGVGVIVEAEKGTSRALSTPNQSFDHLFGNGGSPFSWKVVWGKVFGAFTSLLWVGLWSDDRVCERVCVALTLIYLSVDGAVLAAGGFYIEMMPGAEEDSIEQIEKVGALTHTFSQIQISH